MAGQFVKNGATLKCPLCKSNGTLIVSHTEVQLQDTPCATSGDNSKSNLVFGGVCNKWRKNKPPCASVIAPTQWSGVANDLEIDGKFMLLESSTINCATGGVDISILHTAQMDVPNDLVEEPSNLKKFHINFRRRLGYQGRYGFDWLREEYVLTEPSITIAFDNNGVSMNKPAPLCKNADRIKEKYKTHDVLDPISPYGVDYYPAWLSIFADYYWWTDLFQGQGLHQDGVQVSLEIEELEPLISDATKLIFEPSNDSIVVTPNELDLSSLLSKKESFTFGEGITKTINFNYDVINIKCNSTLSQHEQIKVFAELEGQREEVGKLMVYNNENIPLLEIIPIKIVTKTTTPTLNPSLKYSLETRFLNQALVKVNLADEVIFDINALPDDDPFALQFKNKYGNNKNRVLVFNSEFLVFSFGVFELFEKYFPQVVTRSHKKTFLFYTDIEAEDYSGDIEAFVTPDDIISPTNHTFRSGNKTMIFKNGLTNTNTIKHEIGHVLSLRHVFAESFQETGPYPIIFYQGFTDNIMDYEIQYDGTPAIYKGRMNSLFKSQWDKIRTDNSLDYNN